MKQKDIQAMPINHNLLNLIAPSSINLKRNSVEFGELTSKYLNVSQYPANAIIGWLSNLTNMQNSDITISVEPIDNQVFIEGISKGINTDRTTYNTTRSEIERARAERKIKDAEEIIRDIESNATTYVYVSFTSKINGKDELSLEKNEKIFRNRAAGSGLKTRIPSFLMKEAFLHSSPFSTSKEEITKISNKNMSLLTLMGGLPFSGSGYVDTTGFYLGVDESGRMIALDSFKKENDRTNSNWVICGTSGGGKSFATKKILLNEWLSGSKIIIIDPEKEYKEMCKQIEQSKWIDCSGGRGLNVGRINPLQVSPLAEIEEDDEEYTGRKSALSIHFQNLFTFFNLYFKGELTMQQNAILSAVLTELYKSFNIDWDTDITKLQNNDFPIMQDLYNLLLKYSKEFEESPKNKNKENVYEELAAVVREMAIGSDSDMFNGYTTIETDSSFIVLDTYSIQGAKDNVKRCQYFNMLRFCQDIAFKDRKERCIVACDEAYLLVDPKVPQSIEFLRNFSKRARKYECGLIVITQSIIDFLGDSVKQYGQALFDNATYKLFLGMDGRNLEQASELWNLNSQEKNILAAKVKGQGLLFIGASRLLLRVKGEKFELPFLTGGGR